MSLIIKPRSEIQTARSGLPSIFLAGSIDQGAAENWQDRIERELDEYDVTIFNPRRDNWKPDLKQDISEPEFAYQVNWELDNLAKVDLIFIYFAPTGPAPITLMELGMQRGRRSDQIIVCCPDGYWRKGNVQIMCHREGWQLFDELDSAINKLKSELSEYR